MMRSYLTTAFLVGALAAAPAAAFAAPAARAQTSTSAHAAKKGTSSTHATRGVIKSVDASTLVITRPGKAGGDMTFTLNASTEREGSTSVGDPVSVRYKEEGKTLVATAVHGQKDKAGKTSAPKH